MNASVSEKGTPLRDTILQRIGRIMSAQLEDAVDRMERSGSDSVMREAIRELDAAIDQVRSEHVMATTGRLQAVRRQKLLEDRIEALSGKARFALGEGRDDLAEAALSRQLQFEEQLLEAAITQAASAEEENKLEAAHEGLKTRRQEMADALQAFVASRRQRPFAEPGEAGVSCNVEHRVERAERAFDRAMDLAGGDARMPVDMTTTRAIAEIDAMSRHATIAARLAALRSGFEASSA